MKQMKFNILELVSMIIILGSLLGMVISQIQNQSSSEWLSIFVLFTVFQQVIPNKTEWKMKNRSIVYRIYQLLISGLGIAYALLIILN